MSKSVNNINCIIEDVVCDRTCNVLLLLSYIVVVIVPIFTRSSCVYLKLYKKISCVAHNFSFFYNWFRTSLSSLHAIWWYNDPISLIKTLVFTTGYRSSVACALSITARDYINRRNRCEESFARMTAAINLVGHWTFTKLIRCID